jgi:hypothetical protein
VPSSIEAGLGDRGAACATAAKTRPPTTAKINARIFVSAKRSCTALLAMVTNKS